MYVPAVVTSNTFSGGIQPSWTKNRSLINDQMKYFSYFCREQWIDIFCASSTTDYPSSQSGHRTRWVRRSALIFCPRAVVQNCARARECTHRDCRSLKSMRGTMSCSRHYPNHSTCTTNDRINTKTRWMLHLTYWEVKMRTIGQHEDVMFVTTELDTITFTCHLYSAVGPVVWSATRFISELEIKIIGAVDIHGVSYCRVSMPYSMTCCTYGCIVWMRPCQMIEAHRCACCSVVWR